jgi:hypothetical protein
VVVRDVWKSLPCLADAL